MEQFSDNLTTVTWFAYIRFSTGCDLAFIFTK